MVQNVYLPFAAQHNEPNSMTLGNIAFFRWCVVLNEDADSFPSSCQILYWVKVHSVSSKHHRSLCKYFEKICQWEDFSEERWEFYFCFLENSVPQVWYHPYNWRILRVLCLAAFPPPSLKSVGAQENFLSTEITIQGKRLFQSTSYYYFTLKILAHQLPCHYSL